MRAHWHHLVNMSKLLLPSAHQCAQPKWQISRFSYFCLWANLHHLANTLELVLPLAHPSPQSKQEIDRFSRVCTAHGRESLYFAVGSPFPENCPFPWGIWICYDSLGLSDPTVQMLSRLVELCIDDHSVPILYNGTPLPPWNCYFRWGIWTASNTWFLGSTWVLNPNGILIASAIFAGLTSVTIWTADRPTDHATWLVTIGHIYVRSMGDTA